MPLKLKNVVTGQFLTLGHQDLLTQKNEAKLVKNASKETADVLAEEAPKEPKPILQREFSKFARLCFKIKSRLLSLITSANDRKG